MAGGPIYNGRVMTDDLPPNPALLPTGLVDLLPPEAEAEAVTVGRLMKVFAAHGYERVKPPLGLRGIQATDLIDWDGASDAASIRQLVSDITAMMQTPGPANVQPAPLSERTVVHHKDESPPPAAKKTLFRPV